MKGYQLLAGAAVISAACFALAFADDGQIRQPEPQPIELSGRLHRPVKWTPQLKLDPAGQIKRFDLRGDLLRDIKEGTPIRVRGVVRSRLHRGGTKDDPSAFPVQWIIWLEVTEVEVLDDPRDVLKNDDETKNDET